MTPIRPRSIRPVADAVDGASRTVPVAAWVQIDLPPRRPGFVLAAAIALAAVHLFAVRVTFDAGEPRRRVVSFGAGVSVAYVFVHVLPEIGRVNREIPAGGSPLGFLDRHAYLVALVGFATYYGMERFVRCWWLDETTGGDVGVDEWGDPESPDPPKGVFWVHLASFVAYNGLIGYLLGHREDSGLVSLWVFALALGLHFLVIDFGMRGRYPDRYHDVGRWLLAGAIVLGALVGVATAVHEVAVDLLFAFLGGAIVMNAVNEELPEEHRSSFWAFALGAGAYAVLLEVV